MTGPRVAFWGNIANALAPFVRVLRANGIDAHLFVDERDPPHWRPETDDPTLADGYPAWIHQGPWLRRRDLIAPWRSAAVEGLAGFDLVVGSGNTPSVAPFLEAPFAFFTTGADVTKQPFPWAFRHTRSGIADLAGHAALAWWQRRGIRAAAEVWTQPFAPFLGALDRLGVDPDRIADVYFPLVVDTELFRPDPVDRPSWAAELRDAGDLIVLHPSRLVLDDSPIMQRSGQTKGSGVTLDGFARLVASGVADRPLLVIPDTGGERREADARIERLGIGDHVRFVRPEPDRSFRRDEMAHLYAAADVTVNEFGAGWFGWAALESMSCGTPVISRIDRDGIRRLYGDDWEWWHADDADALTRRLTDAALDPALLADQGRRCRSWVERHHAFDTAGRRMADSVSEALDRLAPRAVPTGR